MLKYVPIINTINFCNQQVDVLRLDLIHPEISGNKWFKLKKNIEFAKLEKHTTIITFGGAYSNHIAATAVACKLANMNSIGIIRGESTEKLNPTLREATNNGMKLIFVSRANYDQKDELQFQNDLIHKFGRHYLIPEGGNNAMGILGCTEIIKPKWEYDVIFCACGTGATFSGIVASCNRKQTVVGINVLKGENTLVNDVQKQIRENFPENQVAIAGNDEISKTNITQHCITNKYSFNGYAKKHNTLIDFKNYFEAEYAMPLDYVYTNKLFYAAFDLIEHNKFEANTKKLIIHCGGLQGNKGFEERFKL